MGRPALRVSHPDGSSVLYYPRGPAGRQSYAAVIGSDGKLKAVEQRLTEENFAKIVIGSTTQQQVRELLGPTTIVTRLPRIARDVWEYKIGINADPYVLWVQFSDDGVVREVLKARDPEKEGRSGPSRW